jgi:hypothetical protein
VSVVLNHLAWGSGEFSVVANLFQRRRRQPFKSPEGQRRMGVGSSLQLRPLVLQGPNPVGPDQLSPSVVEEIDVKPYELKDGSEGAGGLRIRVIRAKGPILCNDIDGFLNVG